MSVLEKFKNAVRRRPRQLELEDYLLKLKRKGIDPKTGHLVMDPVPIAPPIGYKKHPSMVEIVRDMVKSERLAQAARESGHETFEESEDFDVGDEPDMLRSPFENDFDPPLGELLAAGKAEADKKAAGPPEVPAKGATPPEGAKSPPEAPPGAQEPKK